MKACLSFMILSCLVLSTAASLHARAGSGLAHQQVAHKKVVARNFGSPASQKQPRSKRRRSTKNCKAKADAAAITATTASASAAQPTTTPAPEVPVNAEQVPESSATSTSHHHSTTEAPAPAPSSASSSSGSGGNDDGTGEGELHSGGDLTYYATGLGACGITNHDTDFIAAVPYAYFDSYPGYNYDGGSGNPNTNPICNRQAKVMWGGKSTIVTFTDRCGGCDNPNSLDLSPAAYMVFDPTQVQGRLHDAQWEFI